MRTKSDAAKNKFALILAGSITLVIIGIWILVLQNQKTPDEVVTKSRSEDLKPLFMIFSKAKDDFKDIKTEIQANKASGADAGSPNDNMIE